MDRLDPLFQHFLRERIYLKNVTAKTKLSYESAWKAFRAAQAAAPERPSPSALISRADLNVFVVHLRE